MKTGSDFKKWLISFTYQERRSKQLERFKSEIKRYTSMDSEELTFEYLNCKAKYQHKKYILALCTITVAVSIGINILDKIFSLLNKTMNICYSSNTQDTFMLCLLITSAIGFILVITSVIIFAVILNDLKQLKIKIDIIGAVTETCKNPIH